MGEFLFIRLSVLFLKCLFPSHAQMLSNITLLMCGFMYPWFVSCLGDIQIGMVDKKGALEVEVIRARGLVGKPGSKALPGECGYTLDGDFLGTWKLITLDKLHLCCFSPAPYVRCIYWRTGPCIAKKKTKVARKTLDPLYQQQLPFEESPGGKVLQVYCHHLCFYLPVLGHYLMAIWSV